MNPKPPTLEQRLALRERPQQPVVMHQKWRSLLFLHWEFEPEAVQATLPPGLTVDLFAGKCYVGIVPFFMRDIRPRFVPAIPGVANFLEVNVRTYVCDQHGNAGVWFYSLDANQWLAVKVARAAFKLPYFYARMGTSGRDEISYRSWRRGSLQKHAAYFRYKAAGKLAEAQPSGLEFFLLERYLLFAYDVRRQKLFKGRVYHPPYQFCPAETTAYDANMLTLNGLTPLSRQPVSALFSPGVDVDTYYLEEVS